MKYAIGFLIASIIWLWLLDSVPVPSEVVYDCSMAEFHPDFPPQVKEECRKLRYENWKLQNEKNTI